MATTSVGKLLPTPLDQTPLLIEQTPQIARPDDEDHSVLVCNRLPPNTIDH